MPWSAVVELVIFTPRTATEDQQTCHDALL
jgi:hypothetical protein